MSLDASHAPALRTRDLPDVETMTRHMAVEAALTNAFLNRADGPRTRDTGKDTVLVPPRHTGAQPHGWYYDDHGGSWAQLIRLTGGRALLVGSDHSCLPSEHDPRRGLPEWAVRLLPWRPVDRQTRNIRWWPYAAVYDGGQWWDPGTEDADEWIDYMEVPFTEEYLQKSADDGVENLFFGIDLGSERPPDSAREAHLRTLADEAVAELLLGDGLGSPDRPAAGPLATVEAVREVLAHAPDIPDLVLEKLFGVAHDLRRSEEGRALARDVEKVFTTCRRYALRRAVSQAPDLTEEALLALVGSPECSLATGVEAARRFTQITPLPDGADLGYPLG